MICGRDQLPAGAASPGTNDDTENLGDADDGRDISLRLVVNDRTGVVTSLRYHVEVAADGGRRIVYDMNRNVVGHGTSTVEPPAWLPTAKERTSEAADSNPR